MASLSDMLKVYIKAVDEATAAIKVLTPLIQALQYEIMLYRAEKAERHAEWFAGLPRWKRILWVMAHGAYLN